MEQGKKHLAYTIHGLIAAFALACMLVLAGCGQAPAGSFRADEGSGAAEGASAWQPSKGALTRLDENGEPRYRFGYGHGYHRFTTLASQLEMHRDASADAYRTQMTEPEALVMLQSVAQSEQTAAVGTSWTQFSRLYRNAAKTVSIWSFQNWQTAYTFNTSGDRLS